MPGLGRFPTPPASGLKNTCPANPGGVGQVVGANGAAGGRIDHFRIDPVDAGSPPCRCPTAPDLIGRQRALSQVAADHLAARAVRPSGAVERAATGEEVERRAALPGERPTPPATRRRPGSSKPALIHPPSTLAERQLVDRVRGDDMGDVELRAAGVELRSRAVHERLEPALRRSARIGVGVGQRVIHLPEEAAAEPAPNLDLQRVVIGERAVHDGLRRVNPAVRHERRQRARRPVRDVEVRQARHLVRLNVVRSRSRWSANRTSAAPSAAGCPEPSR